MSYLESFRKCRVSKGPLRSDPKRNSQQNAFYSANLHCSSLCFRSSIESNWIHLVQFGKRALPQWLPFYGAKNEVGFLRHTGGSLHVAAVTIVYLDAELNWLSSELNYAVVAAWATKLFRKLLHDWSSDLNYMDYISAVTSFSVAGHI